jgi:hypothetical protein
MHPQTSATPAIDHCHLLRHFKRHHAHAARFDDIDQNFKE